MNTFFKYLLKKAIDVIFPRKIKCLVALDSSSSPSTCLYVRIIATVNERNVDPSKCIPSLWGCTCSNEKDQFGASLQLETC